jgi:hypothetical protein
VEVAQRVRGPDALDQHNVHRTRKPRGTP